MQEFAAEAAAGSTAEVEAGKLAASKATNPRVKNPANNWCAITARQMLSWRLHQPRPPTTLNGEGRALIDKLNGAQGGEFEKVYVDETVKNHDKDVSTFQAYTKSGDDRQNKSFAKKTLPVIQASRRHDPFHSAQYGEIQRARHAPTQASLENGAVAAGTACVPAKPAIAAAMNPRRFSRIAAFPC